MALRRTATRAGHPLGREEGVDSSAGRAAVKVDRLAQFRLWPEFSPAFPPPIAGGSIETSASPWAGRRAGESTAVTSVR